MKALSIITNFGCHFQCPYCIVKNNHIDVPETTIKSLKKLQAAIDFEKPEFISVSGGGDPLHNYPDHVKYYNKIFKICKDNNLHLEMHTSYLTSDFPYDKCHRVVYHLRDVNQLPLVRRYGNEIVRVVFVVTEDFEDFHYDTINYIADFVSDSDCIDELSFRQMIDKDYRVTNYCQEYLRAGHKKRWWYIEQGDYNSYFVNGTIYYKYSDIGRI